MIASFSLQITSHYALHRACTYTIWCFVKNWRRPLSSYQELLFYPIPSFLVQCSPSSSALISSTLWSRTLLPLRVAINLCLSFTFLHCELASSSWGHCSNDTVCIPALCCLFPNIWRWTLHVLCSVLELFIKKVYSNTCYSVMARIRVPTFYCKFFLGTET